MKSILRPMILGLSLGLVSQTVTLAFVHAEDALKATTTATTPALTTPQGKFIRDLGNQAIAIMADKSVTAQVRSDRFRDILRHSFDLPTIGRFVIGRSWNTATPEQQQEYMRLFESLVIKTYGDRMSIYTGEGFEVVSTRPESERDTVVLSHITHPDGSTPTQVDWRVRQQNGKIGVIDVVVEGVSLSVTQRQEYAAVIQRSGGNISGLLDQMREQVQQASAKKNNG